MDEALIVVAVVSGLFTLAGIQLLNHNWFKKEVFKANTYQTKKVNDLKIKKMAKDLGLSSSKNAAINPGNLADLAKTIRPLLNLAGNNGGAPTEEYEDEDDTGINGLVEFARKNPELVKGFMSKMPQLGGGSADDNTGWL